MPQEILSRTIGALVDKKLKCYPGGYAGVLQAGNTWNTIRIGLHFAFDGAATLAGTPRLIVGMNAGKAATFGDLSCSHFLGYVLSAASFTYNAGGGIPYFSFTSNNRPTIKIGTTESYGTTANLSMNASAGPTVRNAFLLEITKGSPFGIRYVTPGGAAQAQVDITQAVFESLMNMTNMTDAGSVVSGYFAPTAQTMTVDETTNGDLDTIFFMWDKATVPMEASAFKFRIIA